MKHCFPLVCLCTLLAGAGTALADPQPGSAGRPPSEGTPAEYERAQRDDARDGRQQERGERRPPRLSPEERKALRQQINEAGQDLYPSRRRQP